MLSLIILAGVSQGSLGAAFLTQVPTIPPSHDHPGFWIHPSSFCLAWAGQSTPGSILCLINIIELS